MVPNVQNVARIPELVQGRSGAQLNITSRQFLAEYPETERVARHAMLVLSVTAFEDYLREALTGFLVRNWKPEKTYRISFKPQDLPAAGDTHGWLRSKSIAAIVDDYLGRSYDSRFAAICRLVIEYGAAEPQLPVPAHALGIKACEARNCIVHASSIADARAVTALHDVVPGLQIGAVLNVQEALLWRFLGALRDAARVLDVELRAIGAANAI